MCNYILADIGKIKLRDKNSADWIIYRIKLKLSSFAKNAYATNLRCNAEINKASKCVRVIVYKVISTRGRRITANLIWLSNNNARSRGNSRRHLILDAIFVMISDARKVNKPAAGYRFCEFATRKNMDLYSRNYVNSSNWISPSRFARFVRRGTHPRDIKCINAKSFILKRHAN